MKRTFFRIIAFSAIIFQCNLSRGQFYSTGEAPASITWKKIQTRNFNIIFQEEWSENAQKLAGILEDNFARGMGDLASPFRKRFPVLVHSSTVQSNGYVSLAPQRMELVSTPPQESYAQDWISQLSLHEFRHVVQFNKLNQGITRISGWLTGEAARAGVASQIPPWFYEGDAVYSETEHSQTGRGRLPSFRMPLRTVLISRPSLYSYNKAFFGSFRDFVPDHYQYGYSMVTFARTQYGSDVWSKALNFTARNPFMIWPLAFHLIHNYEIDKAKLYRLSMNELKEKYIKEVKSTTYIKYITINHRKDSVFTSWNLPHSYGNRGIIALKTGMSEPAGFVYIDSTGKENRILTIGNSSRIKYDMKDSRIVWDEIIRDPRWERRDYSVLRIMDLKTGKSGFLTCKTRYFSPDFSPDGKQIAVVENDIEGRSFITILDALNGQAIRQIEVEGREAITPEWSGNNEILAVTISEQGKQLEAVNTITGEWKVYIPHTKTDIAEPADFGNFIFFRGSFDNSDQIYAFRKSTPQNLFQITRAIFGARQPLPDKEAKELLFSEYGLHGYNVCRIIIDTTHWRTPDKVLFLSENQVAKTDTAFNTPFAVTSYKKLNHLFNVHSWMPFYTDGDALWKNPLETSISPGIMFFTQNLLSTVISSIGYGYNQGYHQIRSSLVMRAWYPVIELEVFAGGPQRILSLPQGETFPNTSTYSRVFLKTFIPLIYTRGAFISQIQPRIEYEWNSTGYEEEGRLEHGLDYLHLKFTASRFKRSAMRDLYPRWGQTMALSYTRPVTNQVLFGTLFSIQAGLFLPGMFRHHHFILRGGYQEQFPKMYFLPVIRVDFPRGYSPAASRKTMGIMLNYVFPLAYPDLSIGPVIYLKRIRTALFYDMLYGKDLREFNPEGTERYTGYYRSVGAELHTDLHLLRIVFPFSAGIRMGYMIDKSKWFTEFLMSIDTRFF